MSKSSAPRVIRGKGPPGVRPPADHKVRAISLPYLRKDFEDRCAYSQQHLSRAGGLATMEVDHFNSRVDGRKRNKYRNLMLATRNCNGAKSDVWPTSRQKRQGIRFLDCTKENEFIDGHIIEDFGTHQLVGITPAGIYHIENLDLNAPHLVEERRERWEIYQVLHHTKIRVKNIDPPGFVAAVTKLRETFERMIPLPPTKARKMPRKRIVKKTVWLVLKDRIEAGVVSKYEPDRL